MREDAQLTEPAKIRAASLAALGDELASRLMHRSRGSYWLGDLSDSKYYLDTRYSYYVEDEEGVRRVNDYFARIGYVGIRRLGSVYETRLPSDARVSAAFDDARGQRLEIVTRAASKAFAPAVAIINRTSGHLAKFSYMYTNHFRRGLRLYHSSRIAPGYFSYLERLGIIEGTESIGYVLTKAANNYIAEFRVRYPLLRPEDSGDQSPVPFLSLCLSDWQYLAREMSLTTVATFFRLIAAMMNAQTRGRNTSANEIRPLSLDGLRRELVRFGWPKPERGDLRVRLSEMVSNGVVHNVGEDLVSLDSEWLKFGTKALGEAAKSVQPHPAVLA